MVFNCMIIQINNIATLGVIVHFYLFIYSYFGPFVHYNLSPLFSGLCKWMKYFCVNSVVYLRMLVTTKEDAFLKSAGFSLWDLNYKHLKKYGCPN